MCDLIGRSHSVTSPTGCNSMVPEHPVHGRRGEPSSCHHYIHRACEFSQKTKKQAKCHGLLHLWAPDFWDSSWSTLSDAPPVFLAPWALNLLCWDMSNVLAQPSPTSFQALQRYFTQWANWCVDMSDKEVIMWKMESISLHSLSKPLKCRRDGYIDSKTQIL